MNLEEKKLEQLIRQKVNSRHTEFNEAHWLSARKLIDADRAQKRREWRFFAGLFFMAGSCIAFYMLLPRNPAMPASEQQQQQLAPAGKHEQNNADVHHIDIPKPQTASAKHTPAPIAEKISEGQPAANTNADEHVAPVILNSNRKQAQPVSKQKQITRINTAAANRQVRLVNDAKNSNEQHLPEPMQQQAIDAASALPGTTTAKNSTLAPAADKENGSNPKISDPHLSANVEITRAEENRAAATASIAAPQLVEPRHPDKLAYTWLPASAMPVDVPSPLKPLKARNSFIAQEIGATCFNPGKNPLPALNLSVGLMYYYGINEKYGLNAGLFYSRIHQDLDARVYSHASYDFGKNTAYTSVQTLRLDYLEVPLQFFYYPLQKHMIRGGVSYMYLLQSAELVTRAGVRTNENGYRDAINKNDLLLSLGYTWTGKSPLIIGVTGYYGLNDISENAVFRSAKQDRNAGIKLSIGYTLRYLR